VNPSRHFVTAVLMTIALIAIVGLLYPLVVTGLAQSIFPDDANGQILVRNGRAVGSRLIGQPFSSPGYFRSRPSAAGERGYDPTASGGSNFAPTNRTLVNAVAARVATARRENPAMAVPADLVTASGSGLDPHISPAAAEFQVPRVARERGVDEALVRRLVWEFTEGRQFRVLGEPRVNVLLLNLELDERLPPRRR
jgi:potassium-transporting ATPase KdpC subunit